MKIDGSVPGVMEAHRSSEANYLLIIITVTIMPSATSPSLTSISACLSFHLYNNTHFKTIYTLSKIKAGVFLFQKGTEH